MSLDQPLSKPVSEFTSLESPTIHDGDDIKKLLIESSLRQIPTGFTFSSPQLQIKGFGQIHPLLSIFTKSILENKTAIY
jgi:hypothetical protein